MGVLTRIAPLLHYVDFESDQAHEAFAVMGMWHGALPSLGPNISVPVSGVFFKLPPLYYYLVFPFTLLGSDPTLQALPNALFSFFTIPLVMFAVHRLLLNVDASRRFLLAAVGGLWWSLMIAEIVRGTKEWNPSSIPFFSLAFALLAASQIRCASFDRRAIVAWIGLGALLALLVSLHATTLYVMPIVFVLAGAAFVWRSKKRREALALPALGLLVSCACLSPYWYGEVHDGWKNSRGMLALVAQKATTSPTLVLKLINVLKSYSWLDGQFYFPTQNVFVLWAGLLFLLVIILLVFSHFRGDHILLGMLACIWIVFLCSAAEFPAREERFRLPLAMAPLFLALSSLAFLDYTALRNRVLGGLLSLGIVLSAGSNVAMDLRHTAYVVGPTRLAAVSDSIDAFRHIPPGSVVCDSRRSDDYVSDRYLDTYVTHRGLRFSFQCRPGVYQIIPNFKAWSGSDFYLDPSGDALSYLYFPDPQTEVQRPANAREIERSDVLRVFLIQSPEREPGT